MRGRKREVSRGRNGRKWREGDKEERVSVLMLCSDACECGGERGTRKRECQYVCSAVMHMNVVTEQGIP